MCSLSSMVKCVDPFRSMYVAHASKNWIACSVLSISVFPVLALCL